MLYKGLALECWTPGTSHSRKIHHGPKLFSSWLPRQQADCLKCLPSPEHTNKETSSHSECGNRRDEKTDAENARVCCSSALFSALMSPGRQQVGQLRPHDRELTAFPQPLAIKPLHPHVSISGADAGSIVEEGAIPLYTSGSPPSSFCVCGGGKAQAVMILAV